MKIKVETIQELVEIVSRLVREGLTFTASKQGTYWEIELLGGY